MLIRKFRDIGAFGAAPPERMTPVALESLFGSCDVAEQQFIIARAAFRNSCQKHDEENDEKDQN